MPESVGDYPQTGNRSNRPGKEFQRAYMACLNCRKTKAKCEISDDPAACVKCKRERKGCVFNAQRSLNKRRRTDYPDRDTGLTNANRYTNFGDSEAGSSVRQPTHHRNTQQAVGPSSPLESGDRDNARLPRHVMPGSSNLDADVIHTVVSSSTDALGLLFKAAEQQEFEDSDEQHYEPTTVHQDSTADRTPGVGHSSIPSSGLSNPEQGILSLWRFFANLSPLSLISNSFYSDHANHKSLIVDEPLLCCSLLMVSSRYHVLPGIGGLSRAHSIHAKLWRHCEQLIQRLTFGQEKSSVSKARSLGAIKALTLMTEWHPRALHFPPECDGWDAGLAPLLDDETNYNGPIEDANLVSWREEVFEPAKRSDRMSWMLLGLATTLGHELGIFDEPNSEPEDPQLSDTAISKLRVRRLLFLNVNQLALRLGCTSLLPQSSSQSISYPPTLSDDPNIERDTLITLWIEITKLLKTASEMFFSSHASTQQILKSGRYIGLLEHFQPLLAQWFTEFSDFRNTTTPSEPSVQMLYVDYQFVRAYLNSVAVQALVERASTRDNSRLSFDNDFLRIESRPENVFIQEVIEDSREVLSTAIDLGDSGALRFAPIRLFVRIITASIFLLKALSLGVRYDEMQKSLETLDRCINAIRISALDDIHLSSRYAILLERHVRRFRRNFRVHSGLSNLAAASVANKESAVSYANGRQGPGPSSTYMVGVPESSADNQFQFDPDMAIDDWLVQPFDPSIAPFGLGINQSASGLEVDSLDFLWNLGT